MTHSLPRLSALLAVLALAACVGQQRPEDDGPPAATATPRVDVFAHVLALPGSELRDTTGARDAQHVELSITAPIDTVRAFYRRYLADNRWTLVSDVRNGDELTMHARRDTLLLWITGRAMSPSYTIYSLIGAVPRPDSLRPPAPMLGGPRD
jgi:outer membrane lipopolysaccharide assembly protein LptE/RlpB